MSPTAAVFPYGGRKQPARPTLDASTLRVRLAEELDRVRSYERALSVVALELGVSGVPLAKLVSAVSGVLRPMDLIAEVGTSLVVVLPELDREEAEEVAQELLAALSPHVSQVQAGLVTAPQDGLNAEALVAAAQATALSAPPGGLGISGPDLHRLPLGERSVLVADSTMGDDSEPRHPAESPEGARPTRPVPQRPGSARLLPGDGHLMHGAQEVSDGRGSPGVESEAHRGWDISP